MTSVYYRGKSVLAFEFNNKYLKDNYLAKNNEYVSDLKQAAWSRRIPVLACWWREVG